MALPSHAPTSPSGAHLLAPVTSTSLESGMEKHRKQDERKQHLARSQSQDHVHGRGRKRAGGQGGGEEREQESAQKLQNRASSGELGMLVDKAIKNAETESDEIVAMKEQGEALPFQDTSRPSSSLPSQSSPSLGTTSRTSLRDPYTTPSDTFTQPHRTHPPPKFSSAQPRISPPFAPSSSHRAPGVQQPQYYPYDPNSYSSQSLMDPYQLQRHHYPLVNPTNHPYPQEQSYAQVATTLVTSQSPHSYPQYDLHASQYGTQYSSPYNHPSNHAMVPMMPLPVSGEVDQSYGVGEGLPQQQSWGLALHPQPPSVPYQPAPYPYASNPPVPSHEFYYQQQHPQHYHPVAFPSASESSSQPHSRQTSAQSLPFNYLLADPSAMGSPHLYSQPSSPYMGAGGSSAGGGGGSPYRPVVFLPPIQQYPDQGQYSQYPPPPLPYSPPVEMSRGNLAQAKLRGKVASEGELMSEGGGGGGRRKGGGGGGQRNLPRPPAHSPHALWVGNVPSDATHAELWRFFAHRPVPSQVAATMRRAQELGGDQVGLEVTGVESIHLIARSNCAFVNYISDLHLQHSIHVSHGQSLRPRDPRCKDLVCRVRKQEDDNKSGVGAQRTGGMHHNYVSKIRKEEKEQESKLGTVEEVNSTEKAVANHDSMSSTNHSFSTSSSNSSYLGKHFPKRYFILKAHNEDDLKLSVERGVWATQSHNEGVLDQAFRSCKDGVFLFFSANKSGEWYGYGRMRSTISGKRFTKDDFSSGSGSRSDPSLRPSTITEDEPAEFPVRPPMLFSPSEQRFAKSPSALSPSGSIRKDRGESAPPTLASNARKNSEEVARNLHLPEDKRGESLDPKLLVGFSGMAVDDQAVLDQQRLGAAEAAAEQDEDGVWRKDMLPTAEERNARLEKMNAEDSAESQKDKDQIAGWGKPFAVEWIKAAKIPFGRTRHIKNGFNAQREVKISRDGTEIEPTAGEEFVAEFWKDERGPPLPTPTLTLNDDEAGQAGQANETDDFTPSGLVGST